MITITPDPHSLNNKLTFEMVLDRELKPDIIFRMVTDQLTKELSSELKSDIRASITKNIDQLVKDVGKDIVIAGLRELLVKNDKNEEE